MSQIRCFPTRKRLLALIERHCRVARHPGRQPYRFGHDLAKNIAQALALFALSILWMTRRQLMPAQE
jgi:hypothetical protein